MSSLTGVVAIAAGFGHSLALKNDGTVWAWGSNLFGALGNGSYNNSVYPVKVINLCTTQTGINEITQTMNVSIYPNPTSGQIQIQMDDALGNYHPLMIEIYNILGENLYSEKIHDIKSQTFYLELPNGIYSLQIKTEEGAIINKKLVISK